MKGPPRSGDGRLDPLDGVRRTVSPLRPDDSGGIAAGPRAPWRARKNGALSALAIRRRPWDMSWLFWLFVLVLLAAAGGSAYMAYRTYVMRRHEPQSEGVAVQAAARAAPGRGRAGFRRQPPPPGADPPRRRRASHHDRRAGRRGHRDRHQGPRVRAGREGLGRAVAARVRPSGRAVSAKPSTNEATVFSASALLSPRRAPAGDGIDRARGGASAAARPDATRSPRSRRTPPPSRAQGGAAVPRSPTALRG